MTMINCERLKIAWPADMTRTCRSPSVNDQVLRGKPAGSGNRAWRPARQTRRQVIARDDDHLNQSGIIEALCKIKTGGQECGRRTVWVDLRSKHQGHRQAGTSTLYRYGPPLLTVQSSAPATAANPTIPMPAAAKPIS